MEEAALEAAQRQREASESEEADAQLQLQELAAATELQHTAVVQQVLQAERQLEAAKLRKAEQDAKTRLRQEEAARYTQQQRLWWDDEVIHQVAVSKNNYFLEEVRALAPLTCGYLC